MRVLVVLFHPGKAGDRDRGRSCCGDSRYAGAARRPACQHIIHQHHVAPVDLFCGAGPKPDRSDQHLLPRLAPKAAKVGREPMTEQHADCRFTLPHLRQIARQQRGLIEAAVP